MFLNFFVVQLFDPLLFWCPNFLKLALKLTHANSCCSADLCSDFNNKGHTGLKALKHEFSNRFISSKRQLKSDGCQSGVKMLSHVNRRVNWIFSSFCVCDIEEKWFYKKLLTHSRQFETLCHVHVVFVSLWCFSFIVWRLLLLVLLLRNRERPPPLPSLFPLNTHTNIHIIH